MPNGFFVSECVSLISACISEGLRQVTENIPKPPLFDTAATSSGQVAFPIGAWIIGSSIPNKSQSDVRIIACLLLRERAILPANPYDFGKNISPRRTRRTPQTGYTYRWPCGPTEKETFIDFPRA